MLTATERQQRARIAALSRHRPGSIEVDALARDFKAARLKDYIQRMVDDAPALTTAQRDRLALMLRGDPHGASAA